MHKLGPFLSSNSQRNTHRFLLELSKRNFVISVPSTPLHLSPKPLQSINNHYVLPPNANVAGFRLIPASKSKFSTPNQLYFSTSSGQNHQSIPTTPQTSLYNSTTPSSELFTQQRMNITTNSTQHSLDPIQITQNSAPSPNVILANHVKQATRIANDPELLAKNKSEKYLKYSYIWLVGAFVLFAFTLQESIFESQIETARLRRELETTHKLLLQMQQNPEINGGIISNSTKNIDSNIPLSLKSVNLQPPPSHIVPHGINYGGNNVHYTQNSPQKVFPTTQNGQNVHSPAVVMSNNIETIPNQVNNTYQQSPLLYSTMQPVLPSHMYPLQSQQHDYFLPTNLSNLPLTPDNTAPKTTTHQIFMPIQGNQNGNQQSQQNGQRK